jgi:hypothetical protein
MRATEGRRRWRPARRVAVVATVILVALLTACAPGGTSVEDTRRLATLKAEPLLADLEDFGTLDYEYDEAGAEYQAADQNPTHVDRWYRLEITDPHAAGIEFASRAHAHGWNGVLRCAVRTSAVFYAFKTFDKWEAFLAASFSNRGEPRLHLTLETPHVSKRDDVVQLRGPGSPTGLEIHDKCR